MWMFSECDLRRTSAPDANGRWADCPQRRGLNWASLTRTNDGEMDPDMARSALPSSPRSRSSTLIGDSSARVKDTIARDDCYEAAVRVPSLSKDTGRRQISECMCGSGGLYERPAQEIREACTTADGE